MERNSTQTAAANQPPRRTWRRALGAALVRLLERAAASPPYRGEAGLPPEIRFPFF